MKYTLNLDENNYILSIAHTKNDNVELNLDDIDLNYLTCYTYKDGVLTLDETKKDTYDVVPTSTIINDLKQRLANTDYVVTKIAEGVATKDDYADILEQRQAWRKQINELEAKTK